MNVFNRIVAILLWLTLLAITSVFAVLPFRSVQLTQEQLERLASFLRMEQSEQATNFLIGQIAVGVVGLLVFGFLIALEIWTGRRRGIRIRTVQGGSAELDTVSVSRRLTWHLDQLAEIVSVVPTVRSKGGSVDIKLEIEAAPDVDVPMKTDEVVDVTRDVIEQDMGLKLGKLDVHMRYAPVDPEWIQ